MIAVCVAGYVWGPLLAGVALFVGVAIVVVGNMLRNAAVSLLLGAPLAVAVAIAWVIEYPMQSLWGKNFGVILCCVAVGGLLWYAMRQPRIEVAGKMQRYHGRTVKRAQVRNKLRYTAEVERVV